ADGSGPCPPRQQMAAGPARRPLFLNDDGRAFGAVVVDPLGVLHFQADAAVGGAAAELFDGGLVQHLALAVDDGVEQYAADDAVPPLRVALILLEPIPFAGAGRARGLIGAQRRVRALGLEAGGADHLAHAGVVIRAVPLIDVHALVGHV